MAGVTCAAAVYHNGSLVAVVAADFDLAGLCAFLEKLHVGRYGFAYVLENRTDRSHG